jgi:hypothetical protein
MAEIPDSVVEAAAKEIAAWINYAWDGLHDRDISGQYPDWCYNGIGDLSMQGGKPALRRIARAALTAARAEEERLGLVTVPVEPTERMLSVGEAARYTDENTNYRAMIEAARGKE